MMLNYILLSLLLATAKPSETESFKLKALGITIGDMTAKKYKKKNKTEYAVKTEVDFWMVEVRHNVKSVFRSNQLISSTTKAKSSRGNFLSTIEQKEDYYQVDANTYKYHNDEPIEEKITLTVSKMYFEEPAGYTHALTEAYGQHVPIKKVDEHSYQVEVDDAIQTYTYENGDLISVEIDNPFLDYSIERTEE